MKPRLRFWWRRWNGALVFLGLFIYTLVTGAELTWPVAAFCWAYFFSWSGYVRMADQRDLARKQLSELENQANPHKPTLRIVLRKHAPDN